MLKNKYNMQGYTYITTNLITNKIYIGQKKSQRFCPTYFGSGKIIKQSLKKYGTINHKVELIVWTENKDQQNYYEKFWIKTYDATNKEIGYNISKGGSGSSLGNTGHFGKTPWNKGKKMSDEHKQKLSESHKGKKMSEEQKKKISKSGKSRIVSDETRKKLSLSLIGRKSPMEGKQLTDIHKKRIGDSNVIKNKGKSPPNKGKKMSEEQKTKLKDAWVVRKQNFDNLERDNKGRYIKNKKQYE